MSEYDEGYRAGMQKMREVGQGQINELVEALEFLVTAASGEGPPVPERELLKDCVDKARTALAKAKGR